MNLKDIQNLIGQGDTKGAIKALFNVVQENSGRSRRIKNDIIILSNRFEEIKHNENIGLIAHEDIIREHTQINNALLNLIEELETKQANLNEANKDKNLSEKLGGNSISPKSILIGISVLVLSALVIYIFYPSEGDDSSTNPSNITTEELIDLTVIHTRPNQDTVKIEGGLFQMGSEDGESDEYPHEVVVNDFYMDIHEVTNQQYVVFLNAVESHNPEWIELEEEINGKRCPIYVLNGKYNVKDGFENHPVAFVSWEGANIYAKYYGMRLPTEAEWEYAARGGKIGIPNQNKFSGSNQIDTVGWYFDNAKTYLQVVGLKSPNELGLYDMSGNVYEWCNDYYDKKYYLEEDNRYNPQGPNTGATRVVRGGNVFLYDTFCRSANRGYWPPDKPNPGIGFRCVKDVD